MTFARLLAGLLGTVGLGITAFIAITDQSWFAAFYFGPLLSTPLILAIIGRPKRWFDPAVQSAERDAGGNLIYRRYTWLDYLLLALMLLSAIPLTIFRWHMPAKLNPPSDPAAIPMFVFLCMTICAYEWQRRDMDNATVLTWLMVIGFGALLMASGGIHLAAYGFVFAFCGAWSLLRVGLKHTLRQSGNVVTQGKGAGS